MEKTLKQMILNVIDNNERGYSEELATIANYSSGSALKKVLSDPKKEFEKFIGLVQLVNHLFVNDSIEMMVKYSNEIEPNKKTARNMLEYLATNRQFEAFNSLLVRMISCTNKDSQEYARVYSLQYKYELCKTKEDYTTLLREIGTTHVTITELRVYQKMLLNYCFNQLNNFNMVKTLTEEIEHDIESIENDYLKDSYTIRANEIMAYNQLIVHNNVEAARLSADKIIESNARPAFKAHAYYIKGYSYLFTSYENSIGYLNKSVDVYHSLGRENDVNDLRELIEFTGVYWGKLTDGNCYYVKNQLLLDALNGNDISNRLVEAKENIEPEFYLFLEGLNKKNEKKLMLSMIKFIKKNNLFLANLVKLELFKTGYDEEILEELTGIQAA